MQEATSDVITLSSDEEFEETPAKKIKIVSESRIKTETALKMLDSLKEISTLPEKIVEEKTKNHTEEHSVTVIIESNGTVKEENNSLTSSSSVIIIDEDPLEENSLKTDENVTNKDSAAILVHDPSEESSGDPSEANASNFLETENAYLEEKKLEEIVTDERPSTSTASEAHKLLDQFLEVCATSIKGSKYEETLLSKFPKMKKHFNNCGNLHNEPSLKRMLQDHIKMAQFSPPDAVVSFQKIFSYFLDNIRGASIEISEENLPKIRKLEKTCKYILKKLKQLEESEVNFDDDVDSTYLQIDRYSKKLNEVYSKYCQLINKNPHAGRLLYEKVQFVWSDYNEINRAITKAHKTIKFPTYYDIEKCIRKCVSKNNLPLTETQIKEESKNCFVKLGNLLQLRRKKELYEDHCGFITLNEDPANNDPDLKMKLQNSLNEGKKKMKEIIEKYVTYQEDNVNPEFSEDSDNSNYQSSETEGDNEGVNK